MKTSIVSQPARRRASAPPIIGSYFHGGSVDSDAALERAIARVDQAVSDVAPAAIDAKFTLDRLRELLRLRRFAREIESGARDVLTATSQGEAA